MYELCHGPLNIVKDMQTQDTRHPTLTSSLAEDLTTEEELTMIEEKFSEMHPKVHVYKMLTSLWL